MNVFLLIIGLLFCLLAYRARYRDRSQGRDYRLGRHDSEETLVLKAILKGWYLLPNWLVAIIWGTCGVGIVILAFM